MLRDVVFESCWRFDRDLQHKHRLVGRQTLSDRCGSNRYAATLKAVVTLTDVLLTELQTYET